MRTEEKRAALVLFPDALEAYILPKINSLREDIKKARDEARAVSVKVDGLSDRVRWFGEALLECGWLDEIQIMEREMRRLVRYLPDTAPSVSSSLDDEMLTRAREASIVSVAEDGGLKPRRSGSRFFVCCPYHEEKSGSMCLYPDGQYFHCFGCGKHGDVIDLARQLRGLSFVDTVRYLARYD